MTPKYDSMNALTANFLAGFMLNSACLLFAILLKVNATIEAIKQRIRIMKIVQQTDVIAIRTDSIELIS